MWRLALGVCGLVVCAALLLGATSIAAHHSFDAEFDRNKPVTVTGVVTRVDWFNPHAHVFVDVKDESGRIVNWDFELAGPNGLMRRGWRRDSLKPGDTVTVAGYMAKNARTSATRRLSPRTTAARCSRGHPSATDRVDGNAAVWLSRSRSRICPKN